MPDQTAPSTEFDQSVQLLLSAVPAPIRAFLTGPERNATVQAITVKYQLHVDQAGIFERELIYLLLGVTTPDQFVTNLGDGGIDAATVDALVAEVNARVFVPLRSQEQQPQVQAATPPPKPAATVYEAPRARSMPMPPPNLPGTGTMPPPAPRPVPQIPPVAVPVPTPRPPVAPQPVVAPTPAMQTPPAARPQAPLQPVFQPSPVPLTPAVNAAPKVSVPQPAVAAPPAPPPPAPPQFAPAPLVKEYTLDPYHEPIDGK